MRGKPDERDGRILAVLFGHSNTAMYFSALERHLRQQRAELHPRFEMLNAAIGGNQLPEISRLEGSVWAKWLIESQIKGEESAAFEGANRKLPWIAWGPYIWDNTWDRSYFADGVHPGPKALQIFVDKYWKHL